VQSSRRWCRSSCGTGREGQRVEREAKEGESSRYGHETLDNVATVEAGGSAGLLVSESSKGGGSDEKEDLRGGERVSRNQSFGALERTYEGNGEGDKVTEDSEENASGLDDHADKEEDCRREQIVSLAPRGGWTSRRTHWQQGLSKWMPQE
jgi:hypothetical protein